MVIKKGHFSPTMMRDRELYAGREINGANAAQRARVDRIAYQCRLMQHRHSMGMKLTREGVDEYWSGMSRDFAAYQARKVYGAQRPSTSHRLHPFPASSTLLRNFKKYRKAGHNLNVFLPVKNRPVVDDIQGTVDFYFVMERLGKYATMIESTKGEVIDDMIEEVEQENELRRQNSLPEIKILSKRQYERWIDKYLDPFEVCAQREGLSVAIAKYGSFEPGRRTTALGELVIFDAWRSHLKVLDCTRAEFNAMSEDDRKAVKLISPWITTAMDFTSRGIVGLSFSRTPNQDASLECLRMCYRDKTYLLRELGIQESHWNMVCPPLEVSNDSGSEFGKEPFGGARFSTAVRILGSTQMNGAAGVSELRGAMERYYWTSDRKWARYLPGYAGRNPQARNDRKYLSEACICFDEFQALYIGFVAEYHRSPKRGLNNRTPAMVWDELSAGKDYDLSALPSPSQFREACGFYTKAQVTKDGIRFAGVEYSNEFVRNERKDRLADRIAPPGTKLEIMVDPFDLGGISVLAKGELITVRSLDREMAGKSLREWKAEKQLERMKAEAEAKSQEGARREARDFWQNMSRSIMRTSDIGIFGYTQNEIDRMKLGMEFGKGQNEKPYIGVDEYKDPLTKGGTPTGPVNRTDSDDELYDPDMRDSDPKTSLDRFRPAARNRKGKKSPL